MLSRPKNETEFYISIDNYCNLLVESHSILGSAGLPRAEGDEPMNRRHFTKTPMVSTVGRTLAIRFLFRRAMAAAGTLGSDSVTLAQQAEGGLLKIGGFRCVNLVPFKNDMLYDLYTIGYWSYGAFRMDIWRRHGVPFWYPRGSGNLRVAGRDWRPHPLASISSNLAGSVAKADAQGTEGFAIDRDPSTSWYAGDNRPDGKLWVEFPSVTRVKSIRFLGGDSPQNAAKDYTVGLIL